MTAWISMISDEEASDDLLDALDESRSPSGDVENVMRIHSHRPNLMRGHVRLYRAALHDDENTVPPWFQETIAAYVSMLNDCPYSLANHWENARHLIGDDDRATEVEHALRERAPERAFAGKELAALRYTEKLTTSPGTMAEADVTAMREEGFDDGEILEINQVAALFNYTNRLLNGLGVQLGDDIVGYYTPNPDD